MKQTNIKRQDRAIRALGIFGCVMLILSAFTSCVKDYDSCPSEGGGSEYKINLSIVSDALSTRASDHDYTDASKDENFINIAGNDFAIFIFDEEGNFIERFWPTSTSIQQPEDGDIYEYKVFGIYKPSTDNLQKKIKLGVMANWRAFGGNYNSDLTGKTLTAIYGDATNFNYTLPVTTEGTTKTSWTPANGVRGIPMFGLSTEIDLEQIKNTDAMSSIPAIRSVAKIEIVDQVPEGPANITRCVLTSYNSNGRFIPDGRDIAGGNPEWFKGNTQVTNPSMPSPTTPGTELHFVKTTRAVTIDNAQVNKDCFVAYVPEMNLEGLTVSNTSRPVIEIYVEGISTPYVIELSEYGLDGKPKPKAEGSSEYAFYNALLRNHIYRYNVKSVGSTQLDFIIETPWQGTQDQEWDFEDIAVDFAPEQVFKWDASTTNFEEPADSMVEPQRTLLVTTDGWLEGSFTLTQPAKGSWTIALYSDDSTDNSHFRIDRRGLVPSDTGEMVMGWIEGSDVLSGKTNEEVQFRIIPTDINSSTENYKARVVMTCTSFDGQIVEVNLPHVVETGSTSGMLTPTVAHNDYYYVKQNFSGLGDIPADESE